MNNLTLSLLIASCLAGCTSPDEPRLISNSAMEEKADREWKALLDDRAAHHLQVIKEDKAAPPHHTQNAAAFASLVKECALGTRVPDRVDDEAAEHIEEECAHRIINQVLVFSGPDRAYEASMAAKSIDIRWYLTVIPTHVSVD